MSSPDPLHEYHETNPDLEPDFEAEVTLDASQHWSEIRRLANEIKLAANKNITKAIELEYGR